MNKLKPILSARKDCTISYTIVILAFILIQTMIATGNITSSLKGQLVPICAYIVMAISLNLTVGILGELSLGHAGFMSVGAFTGIVVSTSLAAAIPNGPLRLAISMIVGGIFAGIAGLIVGIPVLRLKGDYLAIVTLAFGEIIKNIINVLYIGLDEKGLHFSLLEQHFTLAGRFHDHQRPHGCRRCPEAFLLFFRRCPDPDHAVFSPEPDPQPYRPCHHGCPRQQDSRREHRTFCNPL